MTETSAIDWKARALEAERKASEAWEAYHRLAAEQSDAKHYRAVLEQQQDSLSWRITLPLRFAKRVMVVLTRLMRQISKR